MYFVARSIFGTIGPLVNGTQNLKFTNDPFGSHAGNSHACCTYTRSQTTNHDRYKPVAQWFLSWHQSAET